MTDDFFRSHLDAMIDLRHPLAVLATRMPSAPIEASLTPLFARRERAGLATEVIDLFGTVPTLAGAGVSTAGRPRLPTWLMAGLLYLKHAYNLSYEAVCERWAENNYWQYFCGEVYFQPRLPCDPTNLGRFRQALGEAGVEALLAATIAVVANMKVIAPDEFKRVIVDSTVQEKAIAFPTDSRLLEVARAKLVQLARRAGLTLKQTYEREGKRLRRRAGGYAHAKQYKRLRRVLKRQRTRDKGKLCALHAPEVECIGKGKARQPYEFGVEASLAITEKSGLIVDARTFPGNPYDRHTLTGQLEQTRILLENVPGDPKLTPCSPILGYRGMGAEIAPVTLIQRGKYKTLSARQRKWLKRRQVVEPMIRHAKAGHSPRRCWLKGATGDALHVVLCAAGFNLGGCCVPSP